MLSFIWGLLKIAGIILLAMLLLLLILLCLFLLVPIRYSGNVTIHDAVKEAFLKGDWFFGIFRFDLKYEYPQKREIRFKVLWIDLWKRWKKSKNVGTADAVQKEKVLFCYIQKEKGSPSNPKVKQKQERLPKQETITKQEIPVTDESSKKETSAKKFDRILFKYRSICDKIREVIEHLDYYMDIFRQEETKELLQHTANVLLKILKNIRPRTLKVNGTFGFETPDTTGKVYGFYCMIRPSLGEHVKIEPDFEKSTLSADVCFKGRITLFILVINLLKILFDRRLGALLKKLKHGGKQNV